MPSAGYRALKVVNEAPKYALQRSAHQRVVIYSLVLLMLITPFLPWLLNYRHDDSTDITIPQPSFRPPIGGSFSHCDAKDLAPSAVPPKNVHRLRPSDISLIAAFGDSITTGYIAENDPPREERLDFPGNSFCIGGDDSLVEHVSLPNILRELNPRLDGYSNGIGIDVANARLNVAVGGRKSDDLPRQANELIDRLQAYPNHESQWKLVNIFIGTNDVRCHENFTLPADYKKYLRESLVLLKAALPRTIVSIVQVWNNYFAYYAQEVIYGIPKQCPAGDGVRGERHLEGYRRVVDEIEKEREFESDTFTVVVQHIFDDLQEPLKEASGGVLVDFYSKDVFHISKFGHSLIAKQLWRSLLAPVGSSGKRSTTEQFVDDGPALACPEKECPYIRTVENSLKCD